MGVQNPTPRVSPRRLEASARRLLLLVGVGLCAAASAGCHESELEPKAPEQVWDVPSAEATYAMAPVPAIVDPAPVRAPARSVSLGYVGDEPLAELPTSGPRFPYVHEPFRYQEPYAYNRGYRRGHWVRVPPQAQYGAPSYRTP